MLEEINQVRYNFDIKINFFYMLFNSLLSSPLSFVIWVVAIIIALSVHEFAHALAAYYLGDHTAKDKGRLTLNPLSHVSGMGFLMLMFAGFGWGKPVPFNPYNLKYKKWGPAIVAVAGPLSNLIMAVFAGICLKIIWSLGFLSPENLMLHFLNILVIINVVLMAFNLLPIPPLDGSKILFTFLTKPEHQKLIFVLETRGPFFLIFLLVLDSFSGTHLFGRFFQAIINLIYKILL